MGGWGRTLSGVLELILRSNCPLCGRSTSTVLCQGCSRQVQRCRLGHPAASWQEPLPVFAWGIYGGALKQSIAALKYRNHPKLARPLGNWLAQAWLDSPLAATRSLVIVPIPMHPHKQRQRGFNQAELLAAAFCERTGLPWRHGLARGRATEALFGLSPEAREQTLAGAFQLGQDFLHRRPKQTVLLLDDIFTTGATVRAAVQTLQQHQISVHGVVAVAKTQAHPTSGPLP